MVARPLRGSIFFADGGNLERNLQTILDSIKSGGQSDERSRRISKELQDAIDYLGFDVFVRTEDGTYSRYESFTLTAPVSKDTAWTMENPATKADFFDLLRTLDATLTALSKEIRGINDPARATPNIISVRAYLDAFRQFIDVSGGQPPTEIPAALPRGLLDRLRRVEWLRVSENARQWADTITRIVTQLFS
jgi:hypothetical protein